jgi:hypothetical protein
MRMNACRIPKLTTSFRVVLLNIQAARAIKDMSGDDVMLPA